MKKVIHIKPAIAVMLMSALIMTTASFGQTKVSMPKNKTNISKDLEVGQKTAAEVERTFPMVNDSASVEYINQVGRRLANAVPPEFQHPQFNCQFKIVNASDINAFALPGCFLYVNRGMIEAAKNEGEMAGVMAHEISHSMLRHGTAQGPGVLTQIGAIGAILGGAMIGAPQLGQVAAAGIITPYSRSFEKQADIVGANIMARAGYDPRDLANMFRTIAGEGGGRSPEWISSHPDPGNRFNYINQEASMLLFLQIRLRLLPDFSGLKIIYVRYRKPRQCLRSKRELKAVRISQVQQPVELIPEMFLRRVPDTEITITPGYRCGFPAIGRTLPIRDRIRCN